MADPWPLQEIFSRAGMAPAPAADYLCAMADTDKPQGLLKTRIFILIFFGAALLLSITTILGTWDEQKNGVIDPSQGNSPLTTTPTQSH